MTSTKSLDREKHHDFVNCLDNTDCAKLDNALTWFNLIGELSVWFGRMEK